MHEFTESQEDNQKDWKPGLRWEEVLFFTNVRSGTPARRQVTLENGV